MGPIFSLLPEDAVRWAMPMWCCPTSFSLASISPTDPLSSILIQDLHLNLNLGHLADPFIQSDLQYVHLSEEGKQYR